MVILREGFGKRRRPRNFAVGRHPEPPILPEICDEPFLEAIGQSVEAGGGVDVEADGYDTAALLQEGPPVAGRLGVDQRTEGKGRPGLTRARGDGQVAGMIGRELDEDAVTPVTLVELARGMEEAGTEIEGYGPPGPGLESKRQAA